MAFDEKERYYCCQKVSGLERTAPLCGRATESIIQDISDGLFPATIPVVSNNAVELLKLVTSDFIYSEKLTFSPRAWSAMRVLKCGCDKCEHADNSDAAKCDPEANEEPQGCRHHQGLFKYCENKNCIFFKNATDLIASPGIGSRIVASDAQFQRFFECGMRCTCYPNCCRNVVLKGASFRPDPFYRRKYFVRYFSFSIFGRA